MSKCVWWHLPYEIFQQHAILVRLLIWCYAPTVRALCGLLLQLS